VACQVGIHRRLHVLLQSRLAVDHHDHDRNRRLHGRRAVHHGNRLLEGRHGYPLQGKHHEGRLYLRRLADHRDHDHDLEDLHVGT
jgi:hypothetical protein